MGERRRVSLTEVAEGFEPAEVELWEGEDWGGLFLTVDVTKPVQDKLTALRVQATAASEAADEDATDAVDQVAKAVKLVAQLYDAVLVPAPGHSRKRAGKVVERAYEEGKIGLSALNVGFRQIVEAARPT